ncbi:MAG: pyruvate, phosphate dikinase [Chloroflexi bacterium]|nr:pyruvate, phosphate dikinase [Chloroflexota bacterium]
MAMVYRFEDGNEDKMLLGNKGANLVTMAKLGLPVPPGFVVSIEAYADFKHSGRLPLKDIDAALASLEKKMERRLGRGLAVSVRSSAPVSMPGMMDTVLDIRDKGSMLAAVKQIFSSWDNLRAVEYRRLNHIPAELGTAAVVQAMVFGDRDEKSGTGVVFSRNASTGEPGLFGEYLHRAKGEDLVSGARTPGTIQELHSAMPEAYAELEETASNLEKHFHDMQDIEFTVESGKLYILQTRSGKRSGQAAVKIGVDMVKEGLITREEAVMRIKPDDLKALLHKRLKFPEQAQPLVKGLNAAPGAAFGRVVFSPEEAVICSKKDVPVILVRPETSPDDIQGIAAADGVLTSRGGLTSHAAIVTRAMGKPCICGAEEMKIDMAREQFEARGQIVKKGMEITIDGTNGNVYLGILPLVKVRMTAEMGEVLSWADDFRRLGVRANADTPEMIKLALEFGAVGIGLCRTERQFNAPERLSVIRQFIMADIAAERTEAVARLKQLQKEDFTAIFKELKGKPIIIRLLDLPLHEFLPSETETTDPKIRERVRQLKEVNPMLGHRGVRLGITNPEIYRMQVEAISEAREEVSSQVEVNVSVMIPQIITSQELLWVKKYFKDSSVRVGVMMETVRACMRAGRLAQVADFFSFGTNDLTQCVFAFSREDAEKKFLTTYLELGILQDNPFEVVDVKGVGRLMETAVTWARLERKDIEIGVCGEHGGEPRSIRFFDKVGVDYVSCSPFRLPVARLVAAQASLETRARKVEAVV